jgi:DNA anti-recombination protein RmuC
VKKALGEYADLLQQHRAADAERSRLEESRQGAADQDRRAYAQALRSGGEDPGQLHSQEADRAILAARRHEDALAEAVEASFSDLLAAVDRHGSELGQKVAKAVEARRKAFSEALEAVEAAQAELA